MASKNSSSTILILLLLLITFPFWIVVIGVVGGVLAGVFGAVFGIIGGVLGAVGGIIAWPLKMIFSWHEWGWWPHFHVNGFMIAALIILVVTISKRRGK